MFILIFQHDWRNCTFFAVFARHDSCLRKTNFHVILLAVEQIHSQMQTVKLKLWSTDLFFYLAKRSLRLSKNTEKKVQMTKQQNRQQRGNVNEILVKVSEGMEWKTTMTMAATRATTIPIIQNDKNDEVVQKGKWNCKKPSQIEQSYRSIDRAIQWIKANTCVYLNVSHYMSMLLLVFFFCSSTVVASASTYQANKRATSISQFQFWFLHFACLCHFFFCGFLWRFQFSAYSVGNFFFLFDLFQPSRRTITIEFTVPSGTFMAHSFSL